MKTHNVGTQAENTLTILDVDNQKCALHKVKLMEKSVALLSQVNYQAEHQRRLKVVKESIQKTKVSAQFLEGKQVHMEHLSDGVNLFGDKFGAALSKKAKDT